VPAVGDPRKLGRELGLVVGRRRIRVLAIPPSHDAREAEVLSFRDGPITQVSFDDREVSFDDLGRSRCRVAVATARAYANWAPRRQTHRCRTAEEKEILPFHLSASAAQLRQNDGVRVWDVSAKAILQKATVAGIGTSGKPSAGDGARPARVTPGMLPPRPRGNLPRSSQIVFGRGRDAEGGQCQARGSGGQQLDGL